METEQVRTNQTRPTKSGKTTSSSTSSDNSRKSGQDGSPQSSLSSSPTTCRICLNATFESDESKLDRAVVKIRSVPPANGHEEEDNHPAHVTTELLRQMVSPCRCTGSVGQMHKGCLLLEVQYRRSAICQICQCKYRCVEIRRTRCNTFGAYLAANKWKSLVTLLYFLAIPLITTLWFCNKLRISQIEQTINGSYRATFIQHAVPQNSPPPQSEKGSPKKISTDVISLSTTSLTTTTTIRPPSTSICERNQQVVAGSQTQQLISAYQVHPWVTFIFSYHCDVVWINLLNLILIQLIINNLEHYQQWCELNRPRVSIVISGS